MNTKKLICIILLIVLIPFYVAFALLSSNIKVGETVAKHKQQLNIIVEDGIIADAVDYVPFLIPKAGNYQFTLDFTTLTPGFYTGIVLKDASGKAIHYNGFDTAVGYTANVTLPEGRTTLELHYFSNEQALRDFCADYPIYSQSQLDAIEDKLHFNDRIKSGNWYVGLNLTVDDLIGTPGYVKIGLLIASVVLFGLFMVLFFKDKPAQEDRKTRLTSISIRYSVMIFMIFMLEILLSIALPMFLTRQTIDVNRATISMIMTIFIIDVCAFPLIYLLTRKVPAQKLEKKPLGFGKFLMFWIMAQGLGILGALIGVAAGKLFPSDESSNLIDILLGSSMFLRVLAVGILAPIIEELIFRKLLIDRLIKYGEFLAIFLSGLLFGLFHGNFQQFFYATFLGWLFAFVYIRTGNIRNTILLHMTINLGTVVVSMSLLGKVLESGVASISDLDALEEALMADPTTFAYAALLSLWVIFILLAALIGLIIFIVRVAKKKFALRRLEDEPSKGQILAQVFSNPYAYILIMVLLGQFIVTYLPLMIK